ncbi:MAG: GNAT family N-acetyltransferase [Methanothrix sp.]|jgi:ribosomal-protein-alanine N-acetyltransferase|uniref:Acetyltransferase, GNAT family n=1 Tax=Methanothrix thermoacetophila (strain DSM 6194 / JCM 14653 / NBRC 101360 / PT) TaxID=349307 RepID=A0B8U4_METTP|nr:MULTISPECIES: N-acetyltransferase [Methanothrix]ABK15118.1 Acetyltransferase, GNAT family [Methanothrix thermoacetophila PT]MBC7079298.1 GNAT family N-acetyltransferase [Methanothrix sp.]NPU86762.1 GNAT family N-acetyltransferase [Methanothrix sp.]
MRIRRACIEDLDRIVEIERLCFPEEVLFTRGLFSFLLRNATALVACDDEIMGFVIGYLSGRTGVIYTLDVHPDHRRRGVGSALLDAIEREMRAAGARRFRLEADTSNRAALELYHRSGYVEGEVLRNYYGYGKDAVRLWKEI